MRYLLTWRLAAGSHVMDHAEIGEASKSVSSRRLKSTHTVRLSSKPLKNRRSRAEAFDLSSATEEVIEAVFSGSSYVPVSSTIRNSAPSHSHPHQPKTRKICYVVLDVAPEDDWIYCFPVGSWRRIVMNVFGNAIKYTDSGHIHVSLRASDGSRATGAPTTVTLTITDSGIGMSPQFLANKAFQPFSQENSVSYTTRMLRETL
jgi:signal transduction histidine kinase